jgi:hypothetical protein
MDPFLFWKDESGTGTILEDESEDESGTGTILTRWEKESGTGIMVRRCHEQRGSLLVEWFFTS